MEGICTKIVEMSFAASWLILAVIILRLFLAKAPKGFRYILWALVAVRLICPFSIESDFSLVPHMDGFLTEGTVDENTSGVISGIIGITPSEPGTTPSTPGIAPDVPGTTPSTPGMTPSNPGTMPSTPGATPSAPQTTPTTPNITPEVEAPGVTQENSIQIAEVLPWIWGVGVVLLLVYMLISYVRLWNQVQVSIPIDEKIYICDGIQSPFLFGVIRPSVYIPSFIEKDQLGYILAHEREHIRCMDHVWKPLGFVLLAIHWFNPLVWVAYILMCRDLELACDERVIRHMDSAEKRNYSETLLACSAPGHYISACPVAFGEVGIKERIKRVLSYKKPTVWIIGLAVLLCVAVCVGFMTDPAKAANIEQSETESESETETDSETELGSEADSVIDREPEVDSGAEIDSDTEMDSDTELDSENESETDLNENEKVLYETTADLNHDGIDDFVRTVIRSFNSKFELESGANVACVQVFAGVGNGKYESTPCYTSDYCSTSHNANGGYSLTQRDGKAYLMYSNMYEHQGSAYYEYSVFYLNKGTDAQIIEIEGELVDFATTPFWPQWWDSFHREDVVPQLQQKMSAWIENATVLFILDVYAPVYTSTMEAEISAKEYYDTVWARSDEEEIEDFYEEIGSEEWQLYLYEDGAVGVVEDILEWKQSDLSKWFAQYNGEQLQRIGEDGPADITNTGDVIYYRAQDGEDVQAALKKMLEAMILPRMQASENRDYTITDYALVDMPVMQVSENIWLIEYLSGYYAYDGVVMEWTFEDRLEYVGDESMNGLVHFDLEGSTAELLYMLIEKDGVYRLESYEKMRY